jgi:hypothetical protein
MTASGLVGPERLPIAGFTAFLAEIGIHAFQVVDGPLDRGSEERWYVEFDDGRRVLVARLSPELARDESVRRRYVRDLERLRSISVPNLAEVLAIGPSPDPRDPAAEPPWRARIDPPGQPLATILERAPLPVEEVASLGAALADALHAMHEAGAVLRDLDPRNIMVSAAGRVVFTDIGLARVDVLSSHTASSMMVHASAYAAPEQLVRNTLDQRADLYGLGVILWRALTGTMPFGDAPALFRRSTPLVPLANLRPDAPPVLEFLLGRCLAERPEDRPESPSEVAWVLRGGVGERGFTVERTACQHCGAPLRLGQRLCLSCGRVGVLFRHAPENPRSQALDLDNLREDAQSLAELRRILDAVADHPVHREFLIGDINMYSEQERGLRQRLPARLFNDLDAETATELHGRMRAAGLDVSLVDRGRYPRRLAVGALAFVLTACSLGIAIGFALVWWVVVAVVVFGGAATVVTLSRAMTALNAQRTPPLYRLRATPSALPASDPLVARLAALLDDHTPGDVRVQVGELALLVQRLVDHRAALAGHRGELAEIEMLTSPLVPLVDKIEEIVARIVQTDRELADLDEGVLVRGITAARARADELGRARLLSGLDRIRALEEERALAFHRLLEASTLLRRAVSLGLEVRDAAAEHDRHVQLALAELQK